jgi:hypothetical protein
MTQEQADRLFRLTQVMEGARKITEHVRKCEHGVEPAKACRVPCSWCDGDCGCHDPDWPACPSPGQERKA